MTDFVKTFVELCKLYPEEDLLSSEIKQQALDKAQENQQMLEILSSFELSQLDKKDWIPV